MKFEFAYLRDLHIGNPQKENAERVYAIYGRSSEPSSDEYKILQDYLFRYIRGGSRPPQLAGSHSLWLGCRRILPR